MAKTGSISHLRHAHNAQTEQTLSLNGTDTYFHDAESVTWLGWVLAQYTVMMRENAPIVLNAPGRHFERKRAKCGVNAPCKNKSVKNVPTTQ